MDFYRLFDILPYQQARFPNKTALAQRHGDTWKHFSTGECLDEINRVSAGLLQRSIQPGDAVAILAQIGSPRWNFFDLGAQQIGAIVIPLHASLTYRDLEYIFKEAAIKLCLTASQELYEKMITLQANLPDLQHIFCMENAADASSWNDLVIEPDADILQTIQNLQATITEDHLATIIYTSGTTGDPKGVMLSHKNIVSNIKSILPLVPISFRHRTFSFLPLSHILERMVTFSFMAVGASVYYAQERETAIQDLRQAQPHYFTAVPKVLERAYDAILNRADQRPTWVRRLVRWAIGLGERYRETQRLPMPDYWLQWFLADVLVYRQWRKQLGGKVRGILVGAAALNPKLGRLFSAAGMPVREGYGLTETSPVVAFNRFEPGGVRFGTVGMPVPGVEVKIDQPNERGEGEILVKGPNVMRGYFKKPIETQAVLATDGWLHTGDVGQIVHRHFLKITDRQKDIFKTSTGIYVAPQRVENQMRVNLFIEQCMVVGYNRPYVVALILPNFTALEQWCVANKVHWTAPQFMVLNPRVQQKMEKEVERENEQLAPHQRVNRFHLLHQNWSEESGELTPTLKARRQVILEKYRKEIEELYE
jgi:long-chain acyl-CoA synthetase